MEFPLFNTPLFREGCNMAKSRMSLASIALEGERIEEQGPMATDDQDVNQLEVLRRDELETDAEDEPLLAEGEAQIREADEEFDIDQSDAFAIESLCAWRDVLQHQIKSKTVSLESIAAVQLGVQQIYASQGVRVRTVAQESNMTPEAYGSIVLEGIVGAIGNAMTVQLKRYKDRFTDMFRSSAGMVKKYREKLQSANQELQQKKGEFQGAATVSMHELWGFFSSENKEFVRNIVQGLAHDTAMSHYVLVQYPQTVTKLMDQFTAIISHANFGDLQSTKRTFLEIEKLPHPIDLFDKKYLADGKKVYFAKTSLNLKVGAKRKVLSLQGQSFPKIAELSSAKSISESGGFGHKLADTVGKLPYAGSLVATPSALFSGEVKMTAQDVEKAIQLGEVYVSSVEQYLQIEKQFIAAAERMDAIYEKAYEAEDKEASRLINQLFWYACNLCEAAYNLPSSEVHRALRGARFTGYLARRAIYHKSNKGGAPAAAPKEGEQEAKPAGTAQTPSA